VGVIFVWFFFLLCFNLCPVGAKKGEKFLIWTRIVFLTGQVIFVTEWPKWEFVSFCVGCIMLDKITSM
jgi:predicted membrane channel-forming protein YqfA (hemolysin III family)